MNAAGPEAGPPAELPELEVEGCRVVLEGFEGPLDLLLHLIRENRIDIYDIPIARVTEQYLAYLDLMRELNLDVAGEFLVMAATLLMIKSRMLLPEPEVEEGEPEDDPRRLLVQQLLEYERIREVAGRLGELKGERDRVFVRGREAPPETAEYEIESGLYDLIAAFRELLARAAAGEFQEIAVSRMTIQEKMAEVMEMLEKRPRISLNRLARGARGRAELVVLFLAVLELVRLQVVRLRQRRPCGKLLLARAVAEPAPEAGHDD